MKLTTPPRGPQAPKPGELPSPRLLTRARFGQRARGAGAGLGRAASAPGSLVLLPTIAAAGRGKLLAVRQSRSPVVHCLGHRLTDAE